MTLTIHSIIYTICACNDLFIYTYTVLRYWRIGDGNIKFYSSGVFITMYVQKKRTCIYK
jgi:hypothetical protein